MRNKFADRQESHDSLPLELSNRGGSDPNHMVESWRLPHPQKPKQTQVIKRNAMKQYTLAIIANKDAMLGVKKSKPEWQSGLINGPGGNLEATESYRECIVREVKEETGLDISPERFHEFGVMAGFENIKGDRIQQWTCYLYFVHLDYGSMLQAATQTTADVVELVNLNLVKGNWCGLIDNIPALYEIGRHSFESFRRTGTRLLANLEYNYK